MRSLAPDLTRWRGCRCAGVIVTAARATASHDFVSRFFAPAAGVTEDPVTGSAHCALAPFWAERWAARSCAATRPPARGGTVRVRLDGDRVQFGGHAVTMVRGELLH